MEITSLSVYREVKIQPRQFESATYGVTVQAALGAGDDRAECHDQLIEAADDMLADQLLASIQDLVYAWESAKPCNDEKILLSRVQEQSAYIHLLRLRPDKAAQALNYARMMIVKHEIETTGVVPGMDVPPHSGNDKPATPKANGKPSKLHIGTNGKDTMGDIADMLVEEYIAADIEGR
jgi:hypothetical protein